MLRMPGERRELGAADAEEYPARHIAQRFRRRREIIDLDPAIAGLALPRRALQRQQRHRSGGTRRDGVRAHLGGKGMGSVDHARDLFSAKIVDQAVDAAKTADTPGNRRPLGVFGAPGIGQDRIKPRVAGDRGHQLVGIGGAAEDQDAQWFCERGCHALER